MRAAIWPGVSLLPFTGSTATVTAFWPAALASAARMPPSASAARASSSRSLPTPSSVRRAMLPAWPSTVSDWPLAPVKRLASIARATVPPVRRWLAQLPGVACRPPTKTATLPEKAFGKAENSTFIRFLAYEGRFFAPAAGRRKQRFRSGMLQIRGGVLLPPTVSVPALKTGHGNDFSNSPSRLGRRPRQARSAARRGARQPRLHRDRPRRQQDAGRRAERRQDADRRAAAQRADRRQQASGCRRRWTPTRRSRTATPAS